MKNISEVKDVEDEILTKTSEIWSKFIELEQTHPSDIDDLSAAIQDIQKIVAVRIARRVRPDRFITVKNKE